LNPEKKRNCGAVAAYSIAAVGALLIVAGLVWIMHVNTQPPPLGEDRAAFRRKNLADVRNADAEVMNNQNYVWQDQKNGIVRMPIDKAMELSLYLWENPAQARSNLLARLKKAFPPPAVYD
jgi:hypothetical protein